MTKWLPFLGVLLFALSCQGSCKRGPVSYRSMSTCYEQVPIVMMAGGEAKNMIVPRVRDGRLQVLSLFSSWWPQLGPFVHAPRNAVVADAERNTFVERFKLDAAMRAGVPQDAVPKPGLEYPAYVAVFRDMDAVLPDFAAGHLPTTQEGIDTLGRLRTEYPRTIAKEHIIVYERLSPAWFAFLRGEPDFASKGHT